jgi:hypothetical protein
MSTTPQCVVWFPGEGGTPPPPRVPDSTVHTFIGSPSNRWPLPSCWFRSGGAVPETGGSTPTVWLFGKVGHVQVIGP